MANAKLTRRYTFVEHVMTRVVSVLIVAAAVGPGWRDFREAELRERKRLPHEDLLMALEAQVTGPALPLIFETFAMGLALLAAVEGLSALTRVWIIPRS